ncbi:MAG: c-type cytochrome [Bacteroidota bacterium]|nr:c-type cytochrome [Bacteroidota bacterium]
MKLLIHKILLFLSVSLISFSQTVDVLGPYLKPLTIPIPDSLTQGVQIDCFELNLSNQGIKSDLKTAKLLTQLIDEQAGVADWKSNYGFRPKTGTPYMVIISGYMLVRESRSLLFKLQGYDEGVLFIDKNEIVTNSGGKDMTSKDAEIYLEKGFHSFQIRIFSANRPNSPHELSLAWMYDTNEHAFDWVHKSMFYCSKKKIKNAKMNLGGDGNPEVSPSAVKDYTNSLHPSYSLFDLHDDKFQPKVGGVDFMSNGNLIVSTWDSLGQVFLVKNATSTDRSKIEIKRIALGLAEPLGVKVVDDKIYVLQKQELTQLIDLDGDDVIDEYRTVCNGWGATGNFHEFGFGLVYKEGYFYFALATAIQPGGKSTIPQNKDRGKCLKVGMDGSWEIIASGLRTPNGIGLGVDNEIFIADNQGDWLPSCKILHVTKGAFFGSYSVELYDIGKLEEKPPVVWLPQGEIGNSASQPGLLKDGIYAGQMIHGDVTHGGLKRVFVEKVNGEYQGIVFPFTQGLAAGVNRWCYGPDGALYVGGIGSTGNWSQFGKKWFGLQRLKYNGAPTFEILAVRAKANGMEIEFTEPLADKLGNDLSQFEISQWKYVPTMQYGGPKVDPSKPEVISASFSKDRKKVFLEINGLSKGYVVHIKVPNNWTSNKGNLIWANKGWYTLNNIPEEKGVVTGVRKAASAKSASKTTSTNVSKEISDKEVLAIGAKLIEDSGCKQCHALNEKVLGPSFKQINEKYNADPATLTKLTEKVYKGGSGVWGDQAMGANTHLNKDDIRKLVRWILLQ